MTRAQPRTVPQPKRSSSQVEKVLSDPKWVGSSMPWTSSAVL
jgi:hypothetical protein